MERHPGGAEAALRLISRAGLRPGSRVIDLGAGDGDAVRLLRARGHDAVGIDLAPGRDVERGDIFAPPYSDGSFDAALSQCSLLLTGDVSRALAAAARLLRPGGLLLYSDVVPGGEAALLGLARGAGFAVLSVEDETRAWREYYIRALWRGEAEPPPPGVEGRGSRYLAAILQKEAGNGRI